MHTLFLCQSKDVSLCSRNFFFCFFLSLEPFLCASCDSEGIKEQIFGFELTDVPVFIAAERLFCCPRIETVQTQKKAKMFSKQFKAQSSVHM